MLLPILFFLLTGCLTSWLVIQVFRSLGLGSGGEEVVQHHHTHTGVIPRIGGVGIICGMAVTYLLCFKFFDPEDNRSLIHFSVFFGATCAFLLGFVDDIHPLGAKVKFLAQIILALIVHEMGLSIDRFQVPLVNIVIDHPIISYFLTIIWFVAMMNLMNLIDGLDGLAGGIGLLLMILLAYLGFESAIPFSSILALGMAGALIGFLFHNFPPAKVYMGDSGAYAVGFVIAALSLINSEKGTVLAALIAPVLALSLPIADVAFAIIRRGLKGLPLFRPDRQHIHHRLIRSGLSHRGTVLVLYGISVVALLGGLLAFAQQGRYLPIFLGFAFAMVLFVLRGQKLTVTGAFKNVFSNSVGLRQDTRNALFLRDWLIAEADRADSGKNLWSDYKFVLKKMGFCRAELTLDEETREFYVPNTPHEDPDKLVVETVTFRTSIPARLKLYAERDKFSDAQFELLADLAAEAWTRAMNKWKSLHGEPLTFDAEAPERGDYRARKFRQLYRPTY